jgi:hypothetical protein
MLIIRLSLANLDVYNVILNKKSCFYAKLFNAQTILSMGMKQKNLKFTSIVMRNGLSSTIFVTNGMYICPWT